MHIAVISDMHGNDIALNAVVNDLPSVDQIVCLGDAIQGGPQPHETTRRLQSLNCPVVMGNADAWLLTGDDTGSTEATTQKMLTVREWSLSQLSQEDVEFIKSFQPTVTVSLGDGKQLLCFHGSPRSYHDIILPETPEEAFCQFLGDYQTSILTGGHTHLQQIRRIGNSFFFNPGSVGLAYNRHLPEENFRIDPCAEYALLTYENGRPALEFRRVPFDVEHLIDVYLASGRPYADESVAQYRP
jgi:putative phosphoesterase